MTVEMHKIWRLPHSNPSYKVKNYPLRFAGFAANNVLVRLEITKKMNSPQAFVNI